MAPPSRKPNVVIETRIRSVSTRSVDSDVDEHTIRGRKRGAGSLNSERQPKRPKKKKKKKHSPVIHGEDHAEVDVHVTLLQTLEQPGVQERKEHIGEDVALKVILRVISQVEPHSELKKTRL